MKIYIDADGCPVVDLTINTAKKYGVECVILCDTSHRIERENARTIVVEKGADSVVFRLVNMLSQRAILPLPRTMGLRPCALARVLMCLTRTERNTRTTIFRDCLNFVPFTRRYAERWQAESYP